MRSSEITPELVLVDPELAELARAMLGEPGELPPHARPPAPDPEPEPVVTPAPVDGRPPVVAPALLLVAPVEAPEPVAEPEPVPEPEPVAPEPEPVPVLASVEPEAAPAPPPARRRVPVFFTTLLAASLALNVALVLEIYRSSGETAPVTVVGAGATDDSTPDGSSGASATPPATTPTTPSPATGAAARKQPPATARPKATRPTARAKAAAAATKPRTAKASKPATTKQAEARKKAAAREAKGVSLSWDPAQGATFYNVVLWRDDTRLLDLWPTDPSVRIPESWTYRGKTRQLEPGRYLWFAFAGYGSGEDRRLGERVASGDVVVPPA